MLNGVAGWEYNSNDLKSASLTWTHVFAPTFTNEFLISAKRNEWFGGENEGVDNWPDRLGLPNPFHTPRWPQTSNVGLGNFTFITNDTKKNYEAYYILDDNATKVMGRHEFQFGAHI